MWHILYLIFFIPHFNVTVPLVLHCVITNSPINGVSYLYAAILPSMNLPAGLNYLYLTLILLIIWQLKKYRCLSLLGISCCRGVRGCTNSTFVHLHIPSTIRFLGGLVFACHRVLVLFSLGVVHLPIPPSYLEVCPRFTCILSIHNFLQNYLTDQ